MRVRKVGVLFYAGLLVSSFVMAGLCRPVLAGGPAHDFVRDKGSCDNESWTQRYITAVPPIMMEDGLLELLGQTDKPVAYRYSEAVKLSGQSSGAVAGAWVITRKALAQLYPDSVPQRGRVRITAPASPEFWHIGVFTQVMSYVTGAASASGFDGAEFGDEYNRRDLLEYTETDPSIPTPQLVWIFERLDTGEKIGVKFNIMMVEPPATPESQLLTEMVASGEATDEEVKVFIKYWRDRDLFIFKNADTLEGFFTIVAAELLP